MVYAVYLLTCLSAVFWQANASGSAGSLGASVRSSVLPGTFAVSWAMNMGSAIDMERSVTVMGICALGGTIGGMLS